eukprot:SAG22_NODE_233_length_14378_cov_86.382100_2_plen_113_part_00
MFSAEVPLFSRTSTGQFLLKRPWFPLGPFGPYGRGGEDRPVVKFLKGRVPRWELGSTMLDLGMDSLDTVTMRNHFNKMFNPSQAKDGRLPMEVFAAPNRSLGELIEMLEASL